MFSDNNELERKGLRRIIINSEQEELFKSNRIKTAKYNYFNFIPLSLLYQFKSYFNIYFLLVTIILSIKVISNMDPVTGIVPFAFVMGIALIREFMEDLKKKKYDIECNTSEAEMYFKERLTFVKTDWQSLEVGNIIKVSKDSQIPADILVIKSSSFNNICYFETLNLDGENTLKPREAVTKVSELILRETDVSNINGFLEVDHPNKNIYSTSGYVLLKDQSKAYFNIDNVILRGGVLKNVDYVYGIVIYTGADSKIMQNIKNFSYKTSSIEKDVNKIIVYVIIITFVICFVSTIIGSIQLNQMMGYMGHAETAYLFLPGTAITGINIISIFGYNFIIFNNIIPISLMIVMEVVKGFQVLKLYNDKKLQEDPEDKLKIMSMKLHEDLGALKFIFSDKTGTLTRNEMIFKTCSVFGQVFGDDDLEEGYEESEMESLYNKSDKSFFAKTFNKKTILNAFQNANQIQIVDTGNTPFNTYKQAITEFFIDIVINHSVLTELNKKTSKVEFQGSNPDELVLVQAANELGIKYVERIGTMIKIKIFNADKVFTLLNKFDFTSSRQRSSIVIRDENGKIKLYMKGSDTKILNPDRLDDYSESYLYNINKQHIDSFAREGLRTLCYSMRNISDDDYFAWEKVYNQVKYQATMDKTFESELESVISQLESNMTFLGITALEDKLQENVQEDINDFIEAGINFWMLTGDKLDTAESIGYSCKLFNEDTEVFKIKVSDNKQKTLAQLKAILLDMEVMEDDMLRLKLEKRRGKPLKEKIIKLNRIIANTKVFKDEEPVFGGRLNSAMETKRVKVKRSVLSPQNQINKRNINFNYNSDNEMEYYSRGLKNLRHNPPIRISKKMSDIIMTPNMIADDPQMLDDLLLINQNKKPFLKKKFEKEKFMPNNLNASIEMDDVSIIRFMAEKNYFAKNENHEDYSRNYSIVDKIIKPNIDKRLAEDDYEKPEQFREETDFYKMVNFYKDQIQELEIKKNKLPGFARSKNENIRDISLMNFGLIIEGNSISHCLDPEISDVFWNLINKSRSIICCRCSPVQKSDIVNYVNNKSNKISLAIGDGGNDVNMLKAANIGVGIFGNEGCQAAFNSDYAISKFKYLKRLIFYHGRYFLLRNSYFIYYFFYKSIIFALPNFWLLLYSAFSGVLLWDSIYFALYNTFCSNILVACVAMFHEDIDIEFEDYPNRDIIIE